MIAFGTITRSPRSVRIWVERIEIFSTVPSKPSTNIWSPPRNGSCNSSNIPAKKFLKMSWNAKLIATEPSPHKPMISPGPKAGNAITQAIELPAAQVRVWTSPHLKPGDSCPSSRRQSDIQISLYSLKELSFSRIVYFLPSFIFKDWTLPILPLFAI